MGLSRRTRPRAHLPSASASAIMFAVTRIGTHMADHIIFAALALTMGAWWTWSLVKGLRTRAIEAPKSGRELAEAKHPRVFRFMVWMYVLLIAMAIALATMALFVAPATTG